MISLTVLQQQALARRSQTLCTCYEIIRSDDFIVRLTTHDTKLVIDGKDFFPLDSGTTSASEKTGGLGVRDKEFKAVTSDLITENDLLRGLYKDAMVLEFLFDWDVPTTGRILQERYWITSTTYDGREWKATVESATSWLNQPIGSSYTKDCRHNLYDSKCGLSRDDWDRNGTITSVSDSTTFSVNFTTTVNSYVYAELRWNSGLNKGTSQVVKQNGTTVIYLWTRPPFDPIAGDTFTIWDGCNKTADRCKTKFNNLLNFGGFPFIPGEDRVLRLARPK